VERMAVRLDPNPSSPNSVQRAHQSLHHVVAVAPWAVAPWAVAPWNDQFLLQAIRHYVLPQMTSRPPISAWVVDDTGFPKKGKLFVGVARQYCGQIGKQDNCQVAVSLSVSTDSEDQERRWKGGVPDKVVFGTKPLIAAEQLQRAVADGVPRAPVLADAAYDNDTKFRQAPRNMGAGYGTGIHGGHSTDALRMASGAGTPAAEAMESRGPAAEASPARASPPT
jgi:SRSO17 transposase